MQLSGSFAHCFRNLITQAPVANCQYQSCAAGMYTCVMLPGHQCCSSCHIGCGDHICQFPGSSQISTWQGWPCSMVDGQDNAAADRAVQELRAGRHVNVLLFCGPKKVNSVYKVTGLYMLVIEDIAVKLALRLTPGTKTKSTGLELTDAEATCAVAAALICKIAQTSSMKWTRLAHKQQSSNTVVKVALSKHKCRNFVECPMLVYLSSHPKTLVELI